MRTEKQFSIKLRGKKHFKSYLQLFPLKTKFKRWIVIAIALLGLTLFWRPQEWLDDTEWLVSYLIQMIDNSGWLAPLIYISLIVLSVVISPIPGASLAMGAGMIWHPITAGVYTVIGGFLGSLLAYLIGRILGQKIIKTLTGKTLYLDKNRGKYYLSLFIFIVRLVPIMSFDLISYGAGVIKMPFYSYAMATLLGMIPSTFCITYMSSKVVSDSSSAIKIYLPIIIALMVVFFAVKRSNLWRWESAFRLE